MFAVRFAGPFRPRGAIRIRCARRAGPRRASAATEVRDNHGVKVERARENVFTVTATGSELSALVAGARLALDAMRASPDAPPTAIDLLARVLDDFDRARERLSGPH
jgi:hypothetical protein